MAPASRQYQTRSGRMLVFASRHFTEHPFLCHFAPCPLSQGQKQTKANQTKSKSRADFRSHTSSSDECRFVRVAFVCPLSYPGEWWGKNLFPFSEILCSTQIVSQRVSFVLFQLNRVWRKAGGSCDVPVSSTTYVPTLSPIASLRSTCKLVAVGDNAIQVELVSHAELDSNGRPVSVLNTVLPMLVISAIGLLGCCLIWRRARISRNCAVA